MPATQTLRVVAASMIAVGCAKSRPPSPAPVEATSKPTDLPPIVPPLSSSSAPATKPSLPLVHVADVPLPGNAVRFDYQDVDAARGNLVIAHMNDASVVVVRASDGSVVKVIPGIPTARGVAVASDVGRVFVTSS